MDGQPRTAPAALEIASRLDSLAQRELHEVESLISTLPPIECTALLIEACRCLDHVHVVQLLSGNEKQKLPVQDFDILVRGWNVLLGLLMQRTGNFNGIPLRESTSILRQTVMGMMHCAGRYVILSRTAEMVRHGMVTATADADFIELELSDRTLLDHFHDQVDYGRFAELNKKLMNGFRSASTDSGTTQRLLDVMGRLTFPWRTPHGVMVGYTADPEIDAYFLAAVAEETLQWRDNAGIHPKARLSGCTGEFLASIVHVLMSFHTKHIMFVDRGIMLHPGVNQHMSLTIWKTRADLIESLSAATQGSEKEVIAALDVITVRASDVNYFLTEQAPSVPLVIELCDGYYLTPISSIFRNPFNMICMLRGSTSVTIQNAFREHREEWMADELYALFEGPRYQRASSQTKLRRNGKTVTDIDAAIFDNSTGDLILFQLKWQDFTSSSVRTQRSKAKNFSDQIQGWAQKTSSWIDEFGVPALCRALKIVPSGREPRVRLAAVGRTNARFRSYGYSIESDVLALPWSQLVRLRLSVGPKQDFFELLKQAVLEEARTSILRTPLPYVLNRHDMRINFRDIWSAIEEDTFPAGSET